MGFFETSAGLYFLIFPSSLKSWEIGIFEVPIISPSHLWSLPLTTQICVGYKVDKLTKNLAEKKYDFIHSVFLNFPQFQMSLHLLGFAGQITSWNCSILSCPKVVNQKLSENKDIELVRSVKFYKFCVLCIWSKELLLPTIFLRVCKAWRRFWCPEISYEG